MLQCESYCVAAQLLVHHTAGMMFCLSKLAVVTTLTTASISKALYFIVLPPCLCR